MKQESLVFGYDKLIHYIESEGMKIEETFEDIRKTFVHSPPVRANIRYYGMTDMENETVKLQKNYLKVEDYNIKGECFSFYNSKNIRGCLFYLVTCNEEYHDSVYITELSYHMIQTRCIDLVRKIILNNFKQMLKQTYKNHKEIWVSRFLGPGYYKMPLSEGKKIYSLVEGSQIGVQYHGDMMEPLESANGILLGMEGETEKLTGKCRYCKASDGNCFLCGGI